MESIWIALIVSVIAPVIAGLVTSFNNRTDKKAQWARDDLVAAKAAEAAKLLLAANERVAATAKVTNNKLDMIHTLVNSNMTAVMQAEYEATKRELILLLHVVELNRKVGNEPTTEGLVEIESTRKKISELHTALNDRLIQR